jgi:hypothetical protein
MRHKCLSAGNDPSPLPRPATWLSLESKGDFPIAQTVRMEIWLCFRVARRIMASVRLRSNWEHRAGQKDALAPGRASGVDRQCKSAAPPSGRQRCKMNAVFQTQRRSVSCSHAVTSRILLA